MKQLSLLLIGLGLSASSAFSHNLEDSGVQIEVLVESGKTWNGDQLPSYPDEAPQISIVKYTVPPHTILPWHTHPSINAGYLISGELTVVGADGKKKILSEGDALIEMVDKIHRGINNGDKPVEIVVFYAGVKDLQLAVLTETTEKEAEEEE